MPGRRSEASQVARKLVMNVRRREFQVGLREAKVSKREKIAPVVNRLALNVARDSAGAAKMATKLAAHHLAENVEEHYEGMVAAAKIGHFANGRTQQPCISLFEAQCVSLGSQSTRLWTSSRFASWLACSARTRPGTLHAR